MGKGTFKMVRSRIYNSLQTDRTETTERTNDDRQNVSQSHTHTGLTCAPRFVVVAVMVFSCLGGLMHSSRSYVDAETSGSLTHQGEKSPHNIIN